MMKSLLSGFALSAVATVAMAAGDSSYDTGMPAWFDTTNIVAFAVALFIVLVVFMAGRSVMNMLDERGNVVREQLEQAQSLREEAQGILAEMKAKQEAAKNEASNIVAQAKADAEAARNKAMADLEASIARRQASAAEKIRQAELSAIDEVKSRAIAIAGEASANVISNHMKSGNATAFMDQAIGELTTRL